MDVEKDLQDIIERYQSRRKLRNVVNKYNERRKGRLKARREDRWVTMGGGMGSHGEKHSGGTPVNIENGVIEEGPKDLKGKKMEELKKVPHLPSGVSKKGYRYFKDSKGVETYFRRVGGKQMPDKLKRARDSQPPEKRWRVDLSHSADDYNKMKCFVTKGGSTIAVKDDGDIVSVCGNTKSTDKGRSLLEFAIKNGGNKLDSFSGNFGLYTHLGFEPVSWTRFDSSYEIPGWDGKRDKKEPVIFFRYVGHPVNISRSEFYRTVPPSKDYDAAQEARDNAVKDRKDGAIMSKDVNCDGNKKVKMSYKQYEELVYKLWMEDKYTHGTPEEKKDFFYSDEGQYFVKEGYEGLAYEADAFNGGADPFTEHNLKATVIDNMRFCF